MIRVVARYVWVALVLFYRSMVLEEVGVRYFLRHCTYSTNINDAQCFYPLNSYTWSTATAVVSGLLSVK
jgi:hypothetical protein